VHAKPQPFLPTFCCVVLRSWAYPARQYSLMIIASVKGQPVKALLAMILSLKIARGISMLPYQPVEFGLTPSAIYSTGS
jgi:hypothetical protein